MSASAVRTALLWTVLGGCGSVIAADTEEPDMEFLEYLGLWEKSDDEWLMFDEPMTADSDKRIDPVPQGEESTENDDEG